MREKSFRLFHHLARMLNLQRGLLEVLPVLVDANAYRDDN